MPTAVTIVDLSNVNAVTPAAFNLMAAAGVDGAELKVSEGRTFDDKFFDARETLAEHAAHLHVGGYHYAHPELNTPKEEADHFLGLYKGHDDERALKVALDMEAPKASGRKLIAWSREWNGLVRDGLGHWPLFYSYPDYIERVMGLTAADKPIGGGLWLASYARNDGKEHPYRVPAPWKRAVLHQFTSNGVMPGVSGYVDVSHGPYLAAVLSHRHAV